MPFQTDQNLFKSIFNHATVGILVCNEKGEVLLANQKAHEIFQYNPNEIVGQPIENFIPKRYHRHHTQYRHHYQQHAETRPMGAGRDLFAQKKNGQEFPVEVSLSPFTSGNHTYVLAFVIDITVRKEMEASKENYQKQINEILNSLKKERELNEMKSNFVSMASHEFKTPLSTILSSAALLSKYTESDQQEKRDKHIERIKASVRNLNGILNDFLSINKIEGGKIQVKKHLINIKEFTTALINDFELLLKKGQYIDYKHYGDETTDKLDAELLRNILINLITNASKFSKDDAPIFIQTELTADKIKIRIKDNGVGISDENQQHLFERFYRGDNVITTPGTGLGLHIVNNYVNLLKGRIKIESQLNQGTTIKLSFKR